MTDTQRQLAALVSALRGIHALPEGRHLMRYCIDSTKSGVSIGYKWRQASDSIFTATAHQETLGAGPDFQSALADAVRNVTG